MSQETNSRRRFLGHAAAASASLLLPIAVPGCKSTPEAPADPRRKAAPNPPEPALPKPAARSGEDVMEHALSRIAQTGPEYAGGLSNHAPMAAEALVSLGRPDAVVPWVESYLKRLSPAPAEGRPFERAEAREALGDFTRIGGFIAFFRREIQEAPWRAVLGEWAVRLAPGLASVACHGVIRTAHAARSLAERDTEARRGELAQGLAYWAARYQALSVSAAPAGRLLPSQAIDRVETMPDAQRARGSTVAALRSLSAFPSFAGVDALVDCSGDAARFVSDLTETFAGVYLSNARPGNVIALIHTITGAAALRVLLPVLAADARPVVLRHGWQASAALYAAFGGARATTPKTFPEGRVPAREDLIERAVSSGDEHAIKLTEACLQEHAQNPKDVYLLAARRAMDDLRGG